MVSNNPAAFSTKIIFEVIRDIAFFPLWWYSRGLLMILEKSWEFLKNRQKGLALAVWAKNIFRPMYGQSDWQGVLISIFVRIFQIIFRSLAMLFFAALTAVFILAWLVLPIFVLFEIFYQLI